MLPVRWAALYINTRVYLNSHNVVRELIGQWRPTLLTYYGEPLALSDQF